MIRGTRIARGTRERPKGKWELNRQIGWNGEVSVLRRAACAEVVTGLSSTSELQRESVRHGHRLSRVTTVSRPAYRCAESLRSLGSNYAVTATSALKTDVTAVLNRLRPLTTNRDPRFICGFSIVFAFLFFLPVSYLHRRAALTSLLRNIFHPLERALPDSRLRSSADASD